MKFLNKALLVFTISITYSAFSQQVVKKDTISGTELSISMDEKLSEELEKLETYCGRLSESKKNTLNNTSTTTTSSATNTKPKVLVANRALTTAEICRNNPKILGYKIQLTIVKSNDEANEVKAYFRRRFPNLKVLTDASLRPNYKILAGSYFNKESAASDLKAIRSVFKSAIAVQYNIFCAEAK